MSSIGSALALFVACGGESGDGGKNGSPSDGTGGTGAGAAGSSPGGTISGTGGSVSNGGLGGGAGATSAGAGGSGGAGLGGSGESTGGTGGAGATSTGGTGGAGATSTGGAGGNGGGGTHSQITAACSRLCETATTKCPDFTSENCMQQCAGWIPSDFQCDDEYLSWVSCESGRPAQHYTCGAGNVPPNAYPNDYCAAQKAPYDACSAQQ